MSGLPAGWVARARSSSWYGAVAQQMNAAGVPESDWLAVVADEDPSLDPTTAVADFYSDGTSAGKSYGLFQLNQNPAGVNGPLYGSDVASAWMAQAIATVGGNATPAQQMDAIIAAHWPGGGTAALADPSTFAGQQRAQRQSLLSDVISQEGGANVAGTGSGVNAAPVNGVAAASSPPSTGNPITDAINSAVNGFEASTANVAQQAFVGGVILAIIAGGFALLASAATSGKEIVPVPV